MKNLMIKKTIFTISILFLIFLLSSCSSNGWSCQKRYVYVPINKKYIQEHQAGKDSFDRYLKTKNY